MNVPSFLKVSAGSSIMMLNEISGTFHTSKVIEKFNNMYTVLIPDDMASSNYKVGDVFTVTFDFNGTTYTWMKESVEILDNLREAIGNIGIPIYEFLLGREPSREENLTGLDLQIEKVPGMILNRF